MKTPKALTLEQAKNLKYGGILHQTGEFNSDGSCRRWRVSGKARTWKRSPERIQVPIKYGLYRHDHITEDVLYKLHLECNCTNPKK